MKRKLICLTGFVFVSSLQAQVPGKVRDIDGNEYNTVVIGKQEWMAENLRTTRLNDGSRLSEVDAEMDWHTAMAPACCWYDNNEYEYGSYGILYNWYAVNTGRLCPSGWHVPGHEEWSQLTSCLGGTEMPGGPVLLNGELKSTRTVPDDHPRWDKPNEGAINKSGFAALPGGQRNFAGSFMDVGRLGLWWSSTAASYPANYAWYRGMRYDNRDVFLTNGNMGNGFSVRCVKD